MKTLISIQQGLNTKTQRRGQLRAYTCVATMSMLCLSHVACLAAGQSDKPIVATGSGKVEGFQTKNGVLAFLGIPFAQPPKGDLRFAPPVEVKPWDGVRTATKSGPAAPQPADASDPASQYAQDEDCLNLDIWTPGIAGRKRPVLVFIHGGAFMFDRSGNPLYDGTNISKRGDIVFASINYRLGALGFLFLEDFGAEYQGSGANGIRDQVLALRWLKNNIAKFGGDPENITIMGESAGAMSVFALMGLPQARGLFQKAIAESAPISWFRTRKEATDLTKQFMEIAGVTDVAALRKLTPQQLLEAQGKQQSQLGENAIRACMPVIDGTVIPKSPFAAIQDGDAKGISLLNGTIRDEYSFFIQSSPGLQSPLTVLLQGWPWLKEQLGDREQDVLDFYNKRNPSPGPDKSSISSSVACVTDAMFIVPHIRSSESQSRHAKVWMYRLDWKSNVKNKEYLNACHGLDLPFLFKSFDPDSADDIVGPNPPMGLSDAMQDAWISFARTGDPNHKGLPEWPAYEPSHRATMIFDTKSKAVEDPDPEVRQLFKDIPL
ncbi:MAG: carboxylesterase/lipase family protein [Verrucomicrobiota bacterium]